MITDDLRHWPGSSNYRGMSQNELIINNLQVQLQQALNEIKQLREQISTLQAHNAISEQSHVTEPAKKESYSPKNSEEEEKLVARETDWLLFKNKNRKKRKANESPEINYESPKKQTDKVTKVVKPPPIILSNVDDFNAVREKLNTGKLDYKTSLMGNKQIKVNVSSDEDYRTMTALINNTNFEWHSYENKASRSIKVMVRNLHPSTSVEEVADELKEKNFKIIEVVQKIKKTISNNVVNHTRLPLYMLEFDRSEDINKIYGIQYINSMKVKIEAIRSSKLIPQCKRCQRYGHTRKFCRRTPTCVKCAGEHLTTSCTKTRNTPAKCINCSEEHPANYRGCTIAKELQKRRDNAAKAKKATQPRLIVPNMVRSGVSYAKGTQHKLVEPSPLPSTSEPSMMQLMQNMMKTLDRVNARLDKLEARNTGAIPKAK